MDMTPLPHIPTTRRELLATSERIARESNPNYLEVLGLVREVVIPHIEKKRGSKPTGFAWDLENKQYYFLAELLRIEALAGRTMVLETVNRASFDEGNEEERKQLFLDCAVAHLMDSLARACMLLHRSEFAVCN